MLEGLASLLSAHFNLMQSFCLFFVCLWCHYLEWRERNRSKMSSCYACYAKRVFESFIFPHLREYYFCDGCFTSVLFFPHLREYISVMVVLRVFYFPQCKKATTSK